MHSAMNPPPPPATPTPPLRMMTKPPPMKNQTTFRQGKKKMHQQPQVQWGGASAAAAAPTWQLRANQFAPKYRQRADKLLDLLQKSNRIKYNSKLEVSLDGNPIPNSNIIRLVEHALSSKNTQKLVGLKRFYTFLMNLGIPKDLIRNHMGKQLVSKRKGPGSNL